MTRKELKIKSKQQLKGKWGLAIATFLVFSILLSLGSVVSSVLGDSDGYSIVLIANLAVILLGGPLSVGISKFCLNLVNGEEAKFNDLFSAFSIYFKTLGLYLLISLITGIGFMLFIVPGIIFALMYSQAFFILAENNEKSIMDCLKESSAIMKNHKLELFVLELSFIGWAILCIFTLGIGYLWLMPYMQIVLTNYYLDIKKV